MQQVVLGQLRNDEMNVRVPRHQINFSGIKDFNNNLTQTLKLKYVGKEETTEIQIIISKMLYSQIILQQIIS